MLANRFRGNAWIKSSVDKTSNTMLWEACLSGGKSLAEEKAADVRKDQRKSH
jgi:hypothetical protein